MTEYCYTCSRQKQIPIRKKSGQGADIHQPGQEDVSQQFEPFNPRRNREKIRQFWSEIKMGYPLDQFFKPLLVSRQAEYGEKARP